MKKLSAILIPVILLLVTAFLNYGFGGCSASPKSKKAAAGSSGTTVPARWTQKSPATIPTALLNRRMAYDSIRGLAVLFGGNQGGVFNAYDNETHEWNGTNWTLRSVGTKPPARSNHAMAYDPIRGRTVVFGGVGVDADLISPLPYRDTWEWDGNNWLQRSVTITPTESYYSMVYFSAITRTVMWSGTAGAGMWLWDGTNWSQQFGTVTPTARSTFSMVYDSARSKIVMFGGFGGGYLSDTWEWDGTNWSQKITSNNPSARNSYSLAYDSVRGKTILFGGGSPLNDTWEWDGTDWTPVSTSIQPSVRSGAPMVYDSVRDVILLFGGYDNMTLTKLNDTWTYK